MACLHQQPPECTEAAGTLPLGLALLAVNTRGPSARDGASRGLHSACIVSLACLCWCSQQSLLQPLIEVGMNEQTYEGGHLVAIWRPSVAFCIMQMVHQRGVYIVYIVYPCVYCEWTVEGSSCLLQIEGFGILQSRGGL